MEPPYSTLLLLIFLNFFFFSHQPTQKSENAFDDKQRKKGDDLLIVSSVVLYFQSSFLSLHCLFVSTGSSFVSCFCWNDNFQQLVPKIPWSVLLQCWKITDNSVQCGKYEKIQVFQICCQYHLSNRTSWACIAC